MGCPSSKGHSAQAKRASGTGDGTNAGNAADEAAAHQNYFHAEPYNGGYIHDEPYRVETTSRPTPIVGTTSRPSSSGETVPGVSAKAVAPVQQTMGLGAGPMVTDATLSYNMLRMTGELRSEQSSGSAALPRPAELGLRPVVRPAKPVGPVTVEIVEEDGDQISITSRSSSQST